MYLYNCAIILRPSNYQSHRVRSYGVFTNRFYTGHSDYASERLFIVYEPSSSSSFMVRIVISRINCTVHVTMLSLIH